LRYEAGSGATAVVFAPAGEDAATLRALLEAEGVHVRACVAAAAFYEALDEGAWCAIVTEEGLAQCSLEGLDAALRRQAAWSDLPLLVLADAAAARVDGDRFLRLARIGNVVIIERPTSRDVLLVSLRSALRARRLQFSTRDHAAALARHADELQAAVEARTRSLRHEMAERHRAEEALADARQLESLGRLTGGVAHDFNNMLQVISGAETLLRMLLKGPEGERAARPLDSIRRASAHGAALTQQLLTYARKQALQSVTLDMDAHLAASADLVQGVLGAAIRLHLQLDPALWPVVVDPAHLDAAILNIASNARDAMAGSGDVRIAARNVTLPQAAWPEAQALAGDFVCLTISDEGEGMSEQTARQAFEPFFTTKAIGKGTGLGLSQVYGFAVQSRGTAFIRREATGTTVGIILPRGTLSPDAMDAAPAGLDRQARLDGIQILYVEDDPAVAETTSALLAGLGAAVTLANGADAAIAGDLSAIDVLLSDVMMPGAMDGIDLARWLADAYPRIPVVLISGYMVDPQRLSALRVELVRKPASMPVLAATILRAAGSRSRR